MRVPLPCEKLYRVSNLTLRVESVRGCVVRLLWTVTLQALHKAMQQVLVGILANTKHKHTFNIQFNNDQNTQ